MLFRSFSSRARQLLDTSPCDLEAVAGNVISLPAPPPNTHQSVFSVSRTFWFFLAQVLSSAQTCREGLRQAQAWLSCEKNQTVSSSTSAYCQARSRMPHQYAEQAFQNTLEPMKAYECPCWMGRNVKLTDGSSLSMPDTSANQKEYPQSKRQTPGCGFPVMRIVALFSLATGAILAVAKGPLTVAERTLWRPLWNLLEAGDVMLADRGFCSYADYWLLAQRGVDCVMRLNARRTVGVEVIRQLGKDDELVNWIKSSFQPKWLTRKQWENLPDAFAVRHITIRVAWPGFRSQTITVATTLLDPIEYPAEAFAELYLRRWRAELFLRDIKITMKMDVLRCKTPAMIHKELTMHLIAYNLVRVLMAQAAQQHKVDGFRISFAGAVASIRQWSPKIATVDNRRKRSKMIADLMQCIAKDQTPDRPHRVEPRAKKRRPKEYGLLTKPRAEFKEIAHRNRYTKALS
jgi:hypothetical protein